MTKQGWGRTSEQPAKLALLVDRQTEARRSSGALGVSERARFLHRVYLELNPPNHRASNHRAA